MKCAIYHIILLVFITLLFSGIIAGAGFSCSEEDNGKILSASPGDSIVLVLPENPSTGYRWEMETTGGIVPVSDSFFPSDTGLTGAPGTHLWQFMVKGSGFQKIIGTYRRPWVPVSGGEKKFVLHIISAISARGNTINRQDSHFFPKITPKKVSPVSPFPHPFRFQMA